MNLGCCPSADDAGAISRLVSDVWKTGRISCGGTTPPQGTEFVVIGGGIIGLAVAEALARKGQRSVLLEAAHIGKGASGRNAGLYLPSLALHEHIAHLEAFLERTGADIGYRQVGHRALATDLETASAFAEEARRRTDHSVPITALSPEQIAMRTGVRPGDKVRLGRWYPGGATVNPWRFLGALAQACSAAGALLVDDWPVDRIEMDNGHCRVSGPSGEIRAATVIVAAGAWTGKLLPTQLNAYGIKVRPAQMGAFRSPLTGPGMAVGFGSTYWRGTGDWILAGGCAGLDRTSVSAGDVNASTTVRNAIACSLAETDMRLQGVEAEFGWAGSLDLSPDGKPLVGPVDADGRVWIACGFGGHGLPPALGVGACVADALCDGAPVDARISVHRFPHGERRAS